MKIILNIWILMSIVNILYVYLNNLTEKLIDEIDKETNHVSSRKTIMIILLVIITIIAPYIFLFETLPNIFTDIKRSIKYKIIIYKRSKK